MAKVTLCIRVGAGDAGTEVRAGCRVVVVCTARQRRLSVAACSSLGTLLLCAPFLWLSCVWSDDSIPMVCVFGPMLQLGGAGKVTALQAAGQQEEAEELEPASDDVAEEACGCDIGGEEGSGGCQYAAWELPLLPGQNMFNVTLMLPANGSSSDGSANDSGSDDGDLEEHQASLAVVRLADPDHAELESLTGDCPGRRSCCS